MDAVQSCVPLSCHRTLTLPVVTSKLGHSLENLYRVGSQGTTENRSASLGDHGTFVSVGVWVCVCVGVGVGVRVFFVC